jgi:hypothetical protein
MHKVICAASRNSWKARPKTVIARYAKQRKPYFLEGFSRVNIRALARILLYSSKSGHEKPWLKLGRPRPKAKYILQSIVNQYREGKAKRTPRGKWNRTWNYVRTRSRSPVLSFRYQLLDSSWMVLLSKTNRKSSTGWRRAFCRTIQRVIDICKLKVFTEGIVKARLNLGRQ